MGGMEIPGRFQNASGFGFSIPGPIHLLKILKILFPCGDSDWECVGVPAEPICITV